MKAVPARRKPTRVPRGDGEDESGKDALGGPGDRCAGGEAGFGGRGWGFAAEEADGTGGGVMADGDEQGLAVPWETAKRRRARSFTRLVTWVGKMVSLPDKVVTAT